MTDRASDLFAQLKAQGLEGVEAIVATAQYESHFLELKRSADDGRGKYLHDNDRKNLEKAVCGFANSEGGVVLWGVGTEKGSGEDRAKARHPLVDAGAFAARLDAAASGVTLPPCPGVESHAIPSGSGTVGYVATFVPMSPRAPHQVTSKGTFLIRTGRGFDSAPYGVIASLFGRPPRPRVERRWFIWNRESPPELISVSASLVLFNSGRGIARDVYASVEGGPWHKSFWLHANPPFEAVHVLDCHSTFLAGRDFRLVPGGQVRVVDVAIDFDVRAPVEHGWSLNVSHGCGDSAPEWTSVNMSPDELALTIDRAIAGDRQRSFGRLFVPGQDSP